MIAMGLVLATGCDLVPEETWNGGRQPIVKPPMPSPPVPPPTDPRGCHDLAPASTEVTKVFVPGECPLAGAEQGGRLHDGVYTEVEGGFLCRSLAGPPTSTGQAVRVRISGNGTRLDWSAARPVFSADVAVEGTRLAIRETCRDGEAGAAQPPVKYGLSASADEFTLIDGLWQMTLRRDP